MADKELYLLAQFDEETEKTLEGYYKVLQEHGFVGKQTKNIPYHFTLGSCSTDCEEQLIHKMDELCSNTDCIDIRLDHIGLFGLNVLFIEPNINFELLNLQKSFFNNCCSGYHHWTAHATLLIDEPEIILKALPIVVDNCKALKAQIKSVGLYEFFPTRFIKECNLKRNAK
jgi:2'-5' RNA ligase